MRAHSDIMPTCDRGGVGRDCSDARGKAKDAVGDDEAQNGSTNSTGCPGDVATLKPHKFKGLLQSLEHGITDVLSIVVYC